MTITGDRLTHPKRNTNRHSAPPGSLNMEHILSSQSRKKSANQRPVLAGADQSEPAVIRRSSSDRFHGDKKGSYGVKRSFHQVKEGVWSAETFKVKTINWCAQYFIKLLKWKVKSFLTDAANQIPDNDWTLVAKCDNRCQPMRGLSEANWPITILEKRASICFQNSSKQKLWSNVW